MKMKSTEVPKRTEALLNAYKNETEVKTVLDPKAIEQSTLDKLPSPTGYRLLVLPYAGPKKTKVEFIYLIQHKKQYK